MLIRSGLFAAPLLALVFALPAAAGPRPEPRPPALVQSVGLVMSIRPLRNPVHAAAALRVDVAPPVRSPDPHARLAEASAAPGPVGMPVDPPLLAAVQKAALRFEVVTSTANAAVAPLPLAPALRPKPRPAAQAAPAVPAAPAVLRRPQRRPLAAGAVALAAPAVAEAALLPRPAPRPGGLARKAPRQDAGAELVLAAAAAPAPPAPGKPLVRSKKGSVCGNGAIRGETIPPIPARLRGCGLAEPVRVTEVSGVRLSVPATMDCTTARALNSWVETGLKPALGRKNPPALLQVAAHYACRTRNNRPGAPISEHGRGKAIDISAVVLKSGQTIDVLRDWRKSVAKPLRTAHRAACGIFGTTLGPGSDGYHENHLHFDTANHRNPYCR
jgi:hypothetical protein